MQHLIDTLINGPTRYTEHHHLSAVASLTIVLGILLLQTVISCLVVVGIYSAILNLGSFISFALRRLGVGEKDIEQTFVELSFPVDASKSAHATEQLHILLRGIVKYRGFWDKMAARKKPYSLELIATRDEGIRYILMIPRHEVDAVQRNLLSFLPALKFKIVDDYLHAETGQAVGAIELVLGAHFALPLESHEKLSDHDPIAYLTGHMTKLSPDELVAFQIVVAPMYTVTHRRIFRKIRSLQHRIALSKNLSSRLQHTIVGQLLRMVGDIIFWVFRATGNIVGIVFDIFFSSDSYPVANTEQRRKDNPYELELGGMLKKKLDQHLYETSMRILVTGSSKEVVTSRVEALITSFQPFASTYQSITIRKRVLASARNKLIAKFQARTLTEPLLRQPTILSSSELSDLYHFPETSLTKTEGFMKSRSRELPAPLSVKHSKTNLDVIVGANVHGGETYEIGMTLKQRQKHTYVIGKTGTGKTTLLKGAIYQDMLGDKGLAVLDPHGDMFRELLGIVPEQRQKDVVVFDPSDRNYPVGINILDPGIDFENEDDRHDWITSAVLSVFKKLSDDKQWGPRMEHILRNVTMTALHTPKPSLFTLQQLLTDKKYQKQIAKTLKDPVLKQFWEKEFKLMGTMQMSAATAPLTHRLGHFITSKMSRHILLQGETTVRISDIMNEGKILLANLSKGDIGEDQSEFFGTILTSLIWMAAYQRTKIREKQRRDFFVYVDEFQNFATPQFGAITSEGRKFHVSLIVSHQNIAQIEDKDLVKVIAGNAATIICLRANPEDEDFILPYMRPEVEKGDIVNLAPYHFYMKVATEDSEEAFSGETVQLDIEESESVQKTVVANSRKKFATTRAKVEAQMEVLFGNTKTSGVTIVEADPKRTVAKKKLHDL